MSINENFRQEEIELISEAQNTQDQNRLLVLSKSVYMNVRKAVAKNRYVDSSVINRMAQTEKASPVLFWVLKNPSCHLRKELSSDDLLNRCVTCDVTELNLYSACMTCTK